MKWVKASERMPVALKDRQRINIKYKGVADSIINISGRWYWNNDVPTEYLISQDSLLAIEWLDESTPPVSANDAALMDVDKLDGVYAVNLSWGINYHPTDLSKVMKAKDCLFIGTGKECADFIYKNKPAPVSAMEDGWVDVRNALPDNEGLYLAWVTNHSFLGPPESFFIVYYGFANDEDATEMFWSYMMKPIDVTHWRPLPPPPSNR